MPRYIAVTRGRWNGGLVYLVVGGPEHGRALSLRDYDRFVAKGVPIVRT